MVHWTEDEYGIALRAWKESEGKFKRRTDRFRYVAAAVGRSEAAVKKRYEQFGEAMRGVYKTAAGRNAHRPLALGEREAIIAEWRAGATYSAIAARRRRAIRTVQEIVNSAIPEDVRLARLGETTRQRAPQRPPQDFPRSIVGMLMGDPPPGRSALDMRDAR